ncbi:LysR family transcriptional regulator [Pseudomonas sp. ANT_J28]|uniref:LysR family transcriptional regulator n=1 Tax=Pseudomonas sp. ANT_J28 TaxID=2597352 RepID=UPI0011F34419|nr:LysR family transcriptional regulator [Pseudomonas sp. ANT_J28]KAA0984259.1 LysR family transcriptional regulator [Pseudomonas sp. ANT_J28]
MDKLNAMAIFVRVVERGSFSAVARELQTSQPTISKVLRALETELGGKLISRSTRHLSLTDEGQRYYSECRLILAAVDAAEHSFHSGREAVAGNLLNTQNLWVYERDAQRHEVRIKGNAQSNNSEAIREMVLGGLGIALSPFWLFSEDLKAGRVTAILLEYSAQSLPVHAVSPANRRQSARVKAFVDYMSQALEEAPELQPIK